MLAAPGDGIKYRAYYVSTGRSNTRVEATGYGFVLSHPEEHYVTVDIGIRTVMIHTRDIVKNFGKNPPFTQANLPDENDDDV